MSPPRKGKRLWKAKRVFAPNGADVAAV